MLRETYPIATGGDRRDLAGPAIRLALGGLALAQLLDVLSTNAVLASVAGASEANPVARLAMAELGALWWLPKAALGALFIAIAIRPPAVRRATVRATVTLAALYALLVLWNLANLLA